MRARKTRHQFYLPDDLTAELEAFASRPGLTKTDILTQAMTAWFRRQKGEELDRQFSPAFERVLRELRTTQRRVDAHTEMLGVFAQHQLMLVAHHPPFDAETRERGQQKFRQLLTLVERRLGEGGVAERLTAPPSTSGDDT